MVCTKKERGYWHFSFFVIICLFFSVSATTEGYYCDVFQDEGTQISGGDLEVDCEYIKFSQEHLNTSNKSFQATIMIKNDNDDNGYLLYPDGAPRYMIIYYHGGYMSHATDLGQTGRNLVRAHYYNGGTQFGSCAGSYMLSSQSNNYFKIWPGRMNGPNVSRTPIDKIINSGSPLIGYNNFKEGDIVKSVFHNNGGSVDTTKGPKGTLFCAMHNSGKLKGYADIWSWKDNDTTGRVCGITGHPEGSKKEDQIRYVSAVMLYLRDQRGTPRVKHILKNNMSIAMDKSTSDKQPLYTRIGDKQYHHFVLECKTAANAVITVTGKDGFDFHLFAAKDTFAFKQHALYADTSSGSSKTLSIPKLESGKWYIGVKLNTTVTTTASKDFPKYSGKLEVLNGIPYTIKATWDNTDILASHLNIFNKFNIVIKNRTVIIKPGVSSVKSLRIYDLKGKLCYAPDISTNTKISHYIWQPMSAGAYIIRIASNSDVLTKHITITY